jgi:hypothetical protein
MYVWRVSDQTTAKIFSMQIVTVGRYTEPGMGLGLSSSSLVDPAVLVYRCFLRKTHGPVSTFLDYGVSSVQSHCRTRPFVQMIYVDAQHPM